MDLLLLYALCFCSVFAWLAVFEVAKLIYRQLRFFYISCIRKWLCYPLLLTRRRGTSNVKTSSTRKGKLTQTVSRQPSKRACKILRDDKRPQSMERVEHNSEDRQRIGQAGQAAKRRRTTHEPGSRPCARRVRPTRTQRHTRYFQRDAGERRLEPYLCGGHKLR